MLHRGGRAARQTDDDGDGLDRRDLCGVTAVPGFDPEPIHEPIDDDLLQAIHGVGPQVGQLRLGDERLQARLPTGRPEVAASRPRLRHEALG